MRMIPAALAVLLIGAPVVSFAADSSHPVQNTESSATPGNQNNTATGTSSMSKDSSPSGAATEMNRGTNRSTTYSSNMNTTTNQSTSSTRARTDTEPVSGKAHDAWVTTKIKSALLADRDTSATRVHVKTRDGVVTLSGKVKTEEAKRAAEADVRKMNGVKDVVNNLIVQSNQTASK